jgi:hypothetical protein
MVFNGSTNAFSNTTLVFPHASYSLFAVYSNTVAPGATAYMNAVYGSNGYPMIGVFGSNQYVSARSVVANTGALTTSANAGWVLKFTGSGWEFPRGGCMDSTGDYIYIVGDTTGVSATFFNAGGGVGAVSSVLGMMLLKYSTDGNFVWRAPTSNALYAFGAASDQIGNLYFAGSTTASSTFGSANGSVTIALTGLGDHSACVGKYSSDGTVQWVAGISSANQDDSRGVCADPFGNVFVCGQYAAACTFNSAPAIGGAGLVLPFGAGVYEGFVAKYSPNGTLIWATHMATSAGTGTLPEWVLADSTGNVYVSSGYSGGPLTLYNATLSNGTPVAGGTVTLPISSGTNSFIAKYSSTGSILWAVQIAGPSGGGNGMVFDSSGNIVVNIPTGSGSIIFNSAAGSGGTNNTISITTTALAKYSPTGSNIWAVSISGRYLGTDSIGNFYTVAAKYSPTGSNLWSASTNGGTAVFADAKGNSYRCHLCNVSWNASNADGTVAASLTITGQYDGFVTKYSPAGFITSSPVLASSNVMVSATYPSPTALTPFTNGVSMTALAGTTLATTGLFVGGPSNYFNGTVSELLLFSNALSFAQRQSVEGYLASKWGLRTLMPLIHPFYSLRPSNRGFSPLDIPGCQLWLDGADLSSMTLSGINVTQWSDKSGSGNHATGGVSPTYSSSAGAVLFNGTSSYLQTSLSAVPTVETVFAVFRASILPTQTDAGAVIFGATGSGGRGFVVITNATSGSTAYQLRYDAYAVGNIALTPYGGVIYNTLTLATAQYTGGQGAGSTNGSSFGSFQSLSFSGSTTTRIGAVSGGGFFNGTINEILIYNTALAAPQRQQIEGYLAAKWGLRGSIPGIASSPLDIPGCSLWLDGNDVNGNGVQPTNGASVSSWKDKSGLGYHAVGNLGTGTYSSNGFAGYPTIQITQSGNMKAPVPAGTFSNAVSAFIVWQKTGGSTGCDALVSRGLGGSGGPFDMYSYTSFGNSPKIIGNGATGSAYYDTITFFRNPNPNIFFFNIASNASTTWNESLNGSYRTLTTSEGTAAYGDAGSNIFIGTRADGFSTMIGNISEIIFYNFSLSTTQRQSIEAYLVAKWGITATVGTAHPYKTLPPTTSQPAQFSEVSPGNWTHDWQPYLRALTRANAGATASFSSNAVTGATPGGNIYYCYGGVLAPNGKIYTIPFSAGYGGIVDPITNTFNSNALIGTISTNFPYAGGVLATNGKIYCMPAVAANIGVIDPELNTFTTFGSGIGNYTGGILAPNGKIYCIPNNATSIGVIDTLATPNTFTTFGTTPGGTAYVGGVLAPNGKIYCIPCNGTSVGLIDPVLNTFSSNTVVGTVPGGFSYFGGVLAPNGKIYCIPYNGTGVGVIDPTVNPPTFSSNAVMGTAPGNTAYTGGVLGPNGKIYCIPRNATGVGVIDPVLNTFTPNAITGTAQGAEAYISGVLAPNGNIYCLPFKSGNIGLISFSGLTQTPSLNYCLSTLTNKF